MFQIAIYYKLKAIESGSYIYCRAIKITLREKYIFFYGLWLICANENFIGQFLFTSYYLYDYAKTQNDFMQY